MKKAHLITSVLFLALIFSSCGKVMRNGKINRDCTGTYLELNNRDHLICNPSMTNSIPDGESVKVKFNTKSSCPSSDQNICELYHKSYGFVEITEIK